MPRSIRLADTMGAAAGIAFAILLFLSVASVDPQLGVSDQELQTWWADSGNRDGFIASMYMLLLACPLLLVFVSRLRTRLQAADVAGWADTVLACGIVLTTALGLCAILRGVVAGSVRFADEPLPGVDTLRFATYLAYTVWDLVILFGIAMVTIISALGLLTRSLPRWFGWLGVPIAVGSAILLAAQSAPLAIPLFNVWVLAGSVHLLRSRSAAPVGAPTRQPEVSSAQV